MNLGGWIHDAVHGVDDIVKGRGGPWQDIGYTAAALSGFPYGPLLAGAQARSQGNPSDPGQLGQPLGGGGVGDDPFGLLASLMGGQQQSGGLYGSGGGRSQSYLGGYGLI